MDSTVLQWRALAAVGKLKAIDVGILEQAWAEIAGLIMEEVPDCEPAKLELIRLLANYERSDGRAYFGGTEAIEGKSGAALGGHYATLDRWLEFWTDTAELPIVRSEWAEKYLSGLAEQENEAA